MSSFQDLDEIMKLVHNNPEAKAQRVSRSRRRSGSIRLVILHRLRKTLLGFCLRVLVNELKRNHKNTTSRVLSVILINL